MPFHPEFATPTIQFGEYVLRPFRRADSPAWFSYLTDAQVTEHTSWPTVTPEAIDALVERVISEYATMASIRWAIARRSDNVLIGSCGYIRFGHENSTAELAYDLAPAYWGSGIMTAALRTVIALASNSQIRRIEALVLTANTRSIAVLERVGFERDALLERHREVRGTLRDFYLYSLSTQPSNDYQVIGRG